MFPFLFRAVFKVCFLLAIILHSSVYAEIYQCKNKYGKMNFSDKPCGDKVEAVTLKAGTTYTKAGDAKQWEAVSLSNSTRELERKITSRQDNIRNLRRTMDTKLADLRYQKSLSTNNMAGATWDKSLSDEMEVVSDKYNALIQYEMKEIEHLRSQL